MKNTTDLFSDISIIFLIVVIGFLIPIMCRRNTVENFYGKKGGCAKKINRLSKKISRIERKKQKTKS